MSGKPRAVHAVEARRYEEAVGWLRRLREAGDSALTGEDLLGWQRFVADPDNRRAFENVQRATRMAPRIRRPALPSAEDLALDEYDGSLPVAEWNALPRRHRVSIRQWWTKREVRAVAAVAAVGLTLATALFLWDQNTFRGDYVESFATGQGQQRDVTLPDGSRIAVGARTGLSVRYSRATRTIVLEHGEALFTVTHNRARPFEVRAAGGTVTAVGTQFNVRRDMDRVTVTVTDGTVEIAREHAPAQPSLTPADAVIPVVQRPATRVTKGQELTFDEGGDSSGAKQADLRRATSWPEGRLEYRRAPLKEVVADVNRYFDREIILGDAAVGELVFSGTVFRDQSVDEWVKTLEGIFNVRVTYTDATHILIVSAPKTEAQSRAR